MIAFEAFRARPVWPNETLAIMPKVNTPIPPRVNACNASDGEIQEYADKAVKKNATIIQLYPA